MQHIAPLLCGSIAMLAAIVLCFDVALWVFGGQPATISTAMQTYFGGSPHTYRAAAAGFVFGCLLTHFTRWGA